MDYSVQTLTKALFSLATVGFPLGLAIKKDFGKDAKRRAQLDIAKLRLELWEKRLGFGEATLSGEGLSSFRSEIMQGAENVWRDINENLSIFAEREGDPVVIVGLAWWRRFLFVYEPVYSRTEYIARFAYATWLAFLVAFVAICVQTIWCYLEEDYSKKAIDMHFLTSRRGHALESALVFILIVLVAECYFFWRAGVRIKPFRKLHMTDRI